MRLAGLILIAVCALAQTLLAADPAPPPKPEEAAEQIVAAAKAKDAAKLKELCALSTPDPWIVSDLLCGRGEHDAAEAYAKSSPRFDLEKLPAYIASRRGKTDDAAARGVVTAAAAAVRGGKPADALEAIDAAKAPPGTVMAVMLQHWRGHALRGLRRMDESVRTFREQCTVAENMGWMLRATEEAHEWGSSAMKSSDFKTALEAWEHRLAIEEKCGRPKSKADALCNVATIHTRLANYPKALEMFERALVLHTEAGTTGTRIGTVLSNICAVHENLGHHEKAIEFGERALEAAKAANEPNALAAPLSNMATAHRALGNFDKAIELAEQAMKIEEAAGDRVSVAGSLRNLSGTYSRRGDPKKALELGLRALAISEELDDKHGVAGALTDVGGLYIGLGQFTKALETLERAREMQEGMQDRRGLAETLQNTAVAHANLGDAAKSIEYETLSLGINREIGNRGGELLNLMNIGASYSSSKDPKKALEFHEQALKIAEETHDKHSMAMVLANIGVCHGSLGDYAQAIAYAQRALAIAEEIGDREGVARIRGHLGNAYSESHDGAKGLAFLKDALRYAEETGNQELVVGNLWNLAITKARTGDMPGGMADARRSVVEMRLLTTGSADEHTTSTRERFDNVFGVGGGLAAALGDTEALSFFAESGRAGTLLESLRGRDALRASAIPESLRKEEADARTAETAAVAKLRKALDAKKVADIATSRTRLDAARDRLREVIGKIQREAKSAAGLLYPECDTLEVIQGRLGEGDVLVLYSNFADLKSGALVVGRDGARVVKLGLTKAVDDACAALTPDDPKSDTGPAVAALKKLVFDPLGLDAKITRVLVSPSGALSYVPFALFVQDREVCYEPSGTTYGLLLADRAKKGESVLALGDPDYDANPEPPDVAAMRGGMKLKRLPATGVEAKAVGDVVLTGKSATEQDLREALRKKPRWHAVHLACHGLVDAERPTLSSLALTRAGDDDGYLTALEVFQMKIPADLVVLSACETGKGKVFKAEGIVGLTRAFMFAGAPRVIVSLWKVDDEATAALMTKFYEGFKKGVPAAKALRDAQTFVRSQDKWKHPFYWAAWVLWGLPD